MSISGPTVSYLQARMEPAGRVQYWSFSAPRREGRRRSSASRSANARERAELARTVGQHQGPLPQVPPEIAVGDGGMGFWKALDEVFPRNGIISAVGFTRTANVA